MMTRGQKALLCAPLDIEIAESRFNKKKGNVLFARAI